MEFTASILTAVDFGFKASKLIHSVIVSVKDGPENVQHTATAVHDLSTALEQLSKCRGLDESSSESLKERILKCVDELKFFHKKLQGLTIEDSEKRRGRFWKRFKSFYNEKELDRMRAVVNSHTAALNLHLAVLQSETIFSIPNQFSTIDRRLVSQQTVSQIPGQLQTISQELEQQRIDRGNETTMSEEHRTTLRRVSHGVNSLQQLVDSAKQEVLAAQAAQGSQTNQKLDKVLEQMLELKLERQDLNRVVEVRDNGHATPETPGLGRCTQLMDSMTRLCGLVNMQVGATNIHNSADVVKCLLDMLSFMMSTDFLKGAAAAHLLEAGFCERCRGQHVETLKACLSSVYAVLLSARHITLNHHGNAKQLGSDTLVRNHRSATTYFLEIGTLFVCSAVTYYRKALDPSGPFPRWVSSASEDVTTRVMFIPSEQQGRHMFRITSHQSFRDDGVFSSIPSLEVNRVIPSESPVFSMVRDGRLDDFLALLRTKKASVRDHDEYGASLLHYANEQPAVCRYLIESGANVNSFANTTALMDGLHEDAMVSPLEVIVNDNEAGDERLRRIVICRKYLLDAGSDPTMTCLPNTYEPTFMGDGFIGSTFALAAPDAMKVILDGIGFSSCRDILGESPLLETCRWSRFSLEGIKLLLQRGASVHDQDSNGNTCLHLCLRSAYYNGTDHWASDTRNTVIYLIQQGADVFAKNIYGVSVSDVAFGVLPCDTMFATKFRQELWDCALANCGYEISNFRRGRQLTIYASPCRHTRWVFEELWAGSEHLAPIMAMTATLFNFADSDSGTEGDGENWEIRAVDGNDWSDVEDGGVRLVSDDGYDSQKRCCHEMFWM